MTTAVAYREREDTSRRFKGRIIRLMERLGACFCAYWKEPALHTSRTKQSRRFNHTWNLSLEEWLGPEPTRVYRVLNMQNKSKSSPHAEPKKQKPQFLENG